MKKEIFVIFIILSYLSSFSQFEPCSYIDFEDTLCLRQFYKDTVSNPNNVWQIGKPKKVFFDSAYSGKNVLITDTIDYYPKNDTSYFIGYHFAGAFAFGMFAKLSGYYMVNSDSINDFGTIEISFDTGHTWIDIIHDTKYDDYIDWWSDKPILTGKSNGWKYFDVFLPELGRHFNVRTDDQLFFRFGFLSDSVLDSLDGLMFDGLMLEDWGMGINEKNGDQLSSKSFPNPARKEVTIEFENTYNQQFSLYVFNNTGQQIRLVENIRSNSIHLDLRNNNSGLYYYKIFSQECNKHCSGKFVVY